MNEPAAAPRDRFLRDVWIVARNELQDALRSRRALVVLLLFLLGSVAGTLLSIKFIHTIETTLSEALRLEATAGTGSMTATLWKNREFRHAVTEMVKDKQLAESLLAAPPLSLFFCGIVFFFTPLLVALTSAPRLTEEIWSGAARFVLFRTTRLAWCLGKYAGQALLLLVALAASALPAWLCGLLRMDDYPALATAAAMLGFALKAWVYALAYLGFVTGLSLLVRNPGLAAALGLLGLMFLAATYHVCNHFAGPGWRRILELPPLLTPRAQYVDLLRPDAGHVLSATLFLLALSLAYLLAGYARLARRDL